MTRHRGGHVVFMFLSQEGLYPSLGIYSHHQITEFARESAEAKFLPDGRWIEYVGARAGIFVPGSRCKDPDLSWP